MVHRFLLTKSISGSSITQQPMSIEPEGGKKSNTSTFFIFVCISLLAKKNATELRGILKMDVDILLKSFLFTGFLHGVDALRLSAGGSLFLLKQLETCRCDYSTPGVVTCIYIRCFTHRVKLNAGNFLIF